MYFLTQAVTIPIYGRLADLFGRKKLLLAAVTLFLAGSILSGFAQNMLMLIAFRALQGLGAGGVQPTASTIVGDIYSGLERVRAQAILSSTWGVSAIVGPLLGAFLVQHVGWPSVFWLNVPFGILCMVIVARFLREHLEPKAHRIDYLGSVLLTVGIGTLMYVLVMAGTIPAGETALLACIAVAFVAALLVHQLRTPEPMIPVRLWGVRVIAIATSGNFAIGAVTMGVSAFLPTYVQGALGGTAVLAGSLIGIMLVSWTCGSITGARVMTRTSYRLTALVGSILLVAGCALLIAMQPARGVLLPIAGSAFLGLGFGFLNSVFINSTQAAVGWEQRGAATASNLFARQLGQAVGTAALGAVFNVGVYERIPDAGTVVGKLMDPAARLRLPPADVARDAAAIALALHGVYLILGVVAVAIVALAFALPADLRPAHAERQ